MYFAILGKTPQLSLAELDMITPLALTRKRQVVFFDAADISAMDQLAGIVKWGEVLPKSPLTPLSQGGDIDPLQRELEGVELVAVTDRQLGMLLKKEYGIKRFKEVTLESANLEVKHEGKEIIDFGGGTYGVVRGWQDIDRFAAIDFDKPGRGMQIGMMPAKLTQILVNIGIARVDSRLRGNDDVITVYDPFCGFGTTGFVANSLGYHFIGSDINITPAKQNQKWRPTTIYAQSDKHFTLYKHDVLDPFTKPFLQAVDVIVTEGRLGPVVKSANTQNKGQTDILLKNIEDIVAVYRGFLDNAKTTFAGVPIIMTVPVYSWMGDVIEQRIVRFATDLGYVVAPVGEIYQRKNQLVGRRVLSLQIG